MDVEVVILVIEAIAAALIGVLGALTGGKGGTDE